jgi:hypothetical protein
LSIPLVRGGVRRNGIYGVRFPQSFQLDEAWLAINRFGGQRMITWAFPLIAVGVISLFLHLQSHPGLTLFLGFGPLVFILIPVLQAWAYARNFRQKM